MIGHLRWKFTYRSNRIGVLDRRSLRRTVTGGLSTSTRGASRGVVRSRPGVSLKSDVGGDDGVLSTLVNQRTSVAADDRVTSSRYMVRSRCLSLSCDHAVSLRIFYPHLRPCLQRRKFESAVSGVKGCFLVTSLDRLFRSKVQCIGDARLQGICMCRNSWA